MVKVLVIMEKVLLIREKLWKLWKSCGNHEKITEIMEKIKASRTKPQEQSLKNKVSRTKSQDQSPKIKAL